MMPRLIRDQAQPLPRDILQIHGRAGKDDLMLRQAPLGTVRGVKRPQPHLNRGKDIHFS